MQVQEMLPVICKDPTYNESLSSLSALSVLRIFHRSEGCKPSVDDQHCSDHSHLHVRKRRASSFSMRMNLFAQSSSYVFFDLFTAFPACTPVALTLSPLDLTGTPGAAKVSLSSLLAFFKSSSPIAVIVLASHF
jgi:hypothetical protein